jgi:hypothetical protein
LRAKSGFLAALETGMWDAPVCSRVAQKHVGAAEELAPGSFVSELFDRVCGRVRPFQETFGSGVILLIGDVGSPHCLWLKKRFKLRYYGFPLGLQFCVPRFEVFA